MVDAELVGRMLVQIALGTPKDAFGEPLDDEASQLWDQMAAEVAAIEAGGDGVEPFTPELAELPEWVEDKPEVEPTAPEPPAGAPTLAPSEEEPAMTATAEPGAPANEARRNATLILEGTPTRERVAREFAPDALTWADLPIPLKWQEYEDDGHKGAVIVGRIDQVWREPGRLRGELVFDLDGVHGREAYRLVRGKYLRGGSILPDDITGADEELVFAQPDQECDPELDPDCEPAEEEDGGGVEELFGPEPERVIFHAGRVRSFTLCAEPAFAEATIDDDDGDQADGAVVETEFTVALAAKVDETPWDANAAMGACSDAACYNAICAGKTAGDPSERQTHKLPHHKTPDSPPSAAGVQQALARFDQTQGLINGPEARKHLEAHQATITAKHEAAALVAAAHTITVEGVPPAWWYEEPAEPLPPIGAVTVTDEGRLYGLLAPAFVPHRSYARQGREVHAPRGTVDYGKWQSAEALVLNADGEVERIDAGPVTMDCNHGPTHSAAAAREHYEHSCSLVATARVGENAHGTWIAGALLPGVSAEQVTRMLASSLSGHWDPHETRRGWTELTAALFVPVPGFPRRQEQARVRVRDGQLVASAAPVHYDRAPVDRAAARRRRLADALALSLGRPTRQQQRAARLAAARERVHGGAR